LTQASKRAFVRVLIRDSLGRILVVVHRNSRAWNLPGGKIEHNEIPETAARREVREETGLLLKTLRLCHEDDFAVGGTTWHGFFYEAEPDDENPYNMEPAKLSRVEFVDLPMARKKGNKAFFVDLIQHFLPEADQGEQWQMPLELSSRKPSVDCG
jgi:8-oxo-dGTP pyrophosphatase MutT (NUDIX family)